MKKIISILSLIFTLALISGLANAANNISFTYTYPTNASTIYPLFGGTHQITLTTNATILTCQFMWNNNGTLFSMTPTSATNRTWNYTSWVPPTLNGNWQNLRYKCGNATYMWSNATSLHQFKIKDSASYAFVDRIILNNSVRSTRPIMNISVYDNATNCTFNFDSRGLNGSMMQSPAKEPYRVYWTNASALNFPETAYGEWHNITYQCQDSCGNVTNSSRYFFKLDLTSPTISGTPTFALGNKSAGGNYLNVTFNVTDKNPLGCGVRLYYKDGTIINASGDYSYNNTPEWAFCYINVTPEDIEKDGYAVVVPAANDDAGHRDISWTNQSWVFYRLKTGWNIITGFENKTTAQMASEFTNITYVSLWDNLNKSFTTYTTGGSTNSGLASNLSTRYGAGAVHFYVNDDVVSMRRHYAVADSWYNATLYHNTTTTKSSWNLVGITSNLTDLNNSLIFKFDLCVNSTGGNYSSKSYCNNVITWTSWYDIQNGQTCSFYRNRLATSCSGIKSTELNASIGDALWIAVSDSNNVTLNRRKW